MESRIAGGFGRTRVRFGKPADITVSVAFHPYVSVFSLLCDGVSELTRAGARSPTTAPAKAVQSLTEPARRAITPVVTPGFSVSPDCLSPGNPLEDTELDDELERLRSLSSDELREDLERTFGDTRWPEHWASVWHRPRLWTHQFASAIEQFGTALQPTWQRSTEQRQREAERIGAAVTRGAADVVLAAAHSRGSLSGTVLEFPDDEAVEIDATGKRIALTPMVGSPHAAPCNLDLPGVVWFGYPLPAAPPGPPQDPASPDELDALLTPIRARLLHALDREHSMHAVTSLITCSAATATHHCDQLVKAGLLRRRRDGKAVLISRTPRGEHLLNLYSVTV